MKQENLTKLKRVDLLELLIAQGKEIDRLTEELARAQEELSQRRLVLDNAGSLAEAALRINGVFEAAQAAADQYLENIRIMEWEARVRNEMSEDRRRDEVKA